MIKSMKETTIIPIADKLRSMVIKHKKRLEHELKIRIDVKEDVMEIIGEAFSGYMLKNIIEAFKCGFSIEKAMLLTNPDYVLNCINLKDRVRSSRLKDVKGRIIGEKGKAKRVMSELAECDISVSENTVGLIGKAENIAIASKALQSLIRGSPHASVYTLLEKNKRKMREAEHMDFSEEEIEEQ